MLSCKYLKKGTTLFLRNIFPIYSELDISEMSKMQNCEKVFSEKRGTFDFKAKCRKLSDSDKFFCDCTFFLEKKMI